MLSKRACQFVSMPPWAADDPAAASARPLPDARLLAESRDGCTEAIMLGHRFTPTMMAEMIRHGLAAVSAERMVAGGKSIEIARVKITDAGRQALAKR
jgi:hypothetical protein